LIRIQVITMDSKSKWPYPSILSSILACANELGISKEQVPDDVKEFVRMRVRLGLHHWPEVIKSGLKEAIECPLGLVCYPSCFWWQDGRCTFPRES
jgi:hypothetical protein